MTPIMRACWIARIPCAAVALVVVMATSACLGGGEVSARAPVASAETLDGAWDITLRLERPLSFVDDEQPMPRSVKGRISLLDDRYGSQQYRRTGTLAFVGVYDMNVVALGLPAPGIGAIPGVVAQRAHAVQVASADSLFLVMNPEFPRHSLRLSGVISGDTASGIWMAESPLGGGGSFALKRTRSAAIAAR